MNSNTSEKKTILAITATVAIAIVCFLLLVKLVYFFIPNTLDMSEIQKIVAMTLDDFKPEPAERLSYVLSLLVIPLILLITVSVVGRYLDSLSEDVATIIYYISISSCIVGVFIIAHLGFEIHGGIYNFYLGNNLSPRVFIWASIIEVMILSYTFTGFNTSKIFNKFSTFLIYLTVGFCFEAIFVLNIIGEYRFYESSFFDMHFNALYFAMNQVVVGKTLGIDYSHQYGLYPQLLEPLFKLIKFNVLNFSIILATIIIISFVSIFLMLNKNIANKPIAIISFFAILYHNYFFFMCEPWTFQPYFEYFPIRFFFPSTAMYLIFRFINNPSKRLYYISSIYYSIGVLWNTDSGIVVLITWLSTLIYSEIVKHNDHVVALKKIAAHAVLTGLVFSTVTLAYGGYILLRFGAWPQFSFDYQKIFYIYGFMMLPMPKFHLWNLVILTYLFGLTYAAHRIWVKGNCQTACTVFMLSIMGVGLFSYYQGRSDDLLFSVVWYPAIILLAIYCDVLISSLRGCIKQYEKLFIVGVITYFLCSASVCLPLYINSYSPQLLDSRILHPDSGGPAADVAQFIRQHLSKGEEMYIVSDNAGYYYQITGASWPFKSPGTHEAVLRKDLNTILDGIRTKKVGKIFVDYGFTWPPPPEIFTEIDKNYDVRDVYDATTTRIGYYERKQL